MVLLCAHGYTRSNSLAISLVGAGFSWKAEEGWLSLSDCGFALAGKPLASAKGHCQVSSGQRLVSCFLYFYGSRQRDRFLYSLHACLCVCILHPAPLPICTCLSYAFTPGLKAVVSLFYSFTVSPEKDVKYLSSPQTFDLVIQNNQTLLKRKVGMWF